MNATENIDLRDFSNIPSVLAPYADGFRHCASKPCWMSEAEHEVLMINELAEIQLGETRAQTMFRSY